MYGVALAMIKVDITRFITNDDIEEGRQLLDKYGTFDGSTVLENPFLSEICFLLTGTVTEPKQTLQDISDWLRTKEVENRNKCYVSTSTLTEFKQNWFIPLKNMAIDVILKEDLDYAVVAGIEFNRVVMERDGDIKRRIESANKVVKASASEATKYVNNGEEPDPKQKLIENLRFCEHRRDDSDSRDALQWVREIRQTSEALLKYSDESQKNPKIHLELFQHEISIYIEANIETIHEIFGVEREKEYLERFEKHYTDLAKLKNSIFLSEAVSS